MLIFFAFYFYLFFLETEHTQKGSRQGDHSESLSHRQLTLLWDPADPERPTENKYTQISSVPLISAEFFQGCWFFFLFPKVMHQSTLEKNGFYGTEVGGWSPARWAEPNPNPDWWVLGKPPQMHDGDGPGMRKGDPEEESTGER